MNITTSYPSYALNHTSGQVAYDFDRDGLTDLILFPSLFNMGSDLPGKAFGIQNGKVVDLTSTVLPAFTTGFVKDWFIAPLAGDGTPDLLLVDHGLELPASQGGFENGYDRLLVASNGNQLSLDSSIATLPKRFYHSAAVGDYLGTGVSQILLQHFADMSNGDTISLLQADASGAYRVQPIGATFSNYAYDPGAVATVHVSGLGRDLLATGTYVNADNATGHKSVSLWDFKGGTPARVANWDLPAQFDSPSQGAFKIIAGDFRNTGHDDLIVLLESVELGASYKRSWVYLAYDPQKGLSDITAQTLGSYDAPRSLDEIKVADVNGDGHPDLVGFSSDSSVFAGNGQILLNDGTGHFSWMNTKSISSDQAVFIPRFKQDALGNLSDLQGFFKLALTNTQSADISYQPLASVAGTGPDLADPASMGAPGFNELYYLHTHPDAAAAVASGQYASGLDHYLKVGKAAHYQSFAPGSSITGTAGTDTVIYSGSRADYSIATTASGITVAGKNASGQPDTLTGIERIAFADTAIAFDTQGNAGKAYRLYQAAFDRKPDTSGLSFQTKVLDGGWGLTDIAKNFIDSPEFSSKYGSLNNTQFVTQLYANVLHREPDARGLTYHVTNLDHGMSRAQVLVGFSESPENQAAIIGVIQNGIELV